MYYNLKKKQEIYMYLKIDTEVERFELVFKGFERPFTFQIIWKRIPNFRPSEGETVSVIVGSGSR